MGGGRHIVARRLPPVGTGQAVMTARPGNREAPRGDAGAAFDAEA